ncbi:MAG TPA: enoyl-CoA hydratase-related protein [Acidimicrobiia bacterium]|nr:enoyl-CoA hydratase-related protein [Acidimicrobiia bacterium]
MSDQSPDPRAAERRDGDERPFVAVDVRDDGVAVLRLDRPPLNPLSRALLADLAAAARRVAADAAVRAVVVCGSAKALAAGADIEEFDDPAAARSVTAAFRDALDAVAGIGVPVIAAINGYALGGGLELALACDLRVAGDSARLGQPEILLGIIPGGGATQRLARLVGSARAKELIWSGRQVRADEALAIGLVDRVVPSDDLETNAIEWAAGFAAGPAVAIRLAKRAVDEGLDGPLAEGLDLESDLFVEVFESDDAAIGIRSFREQGPGKAEFTGR